MIHDNQLTPPDHATHDDHSHDHVIVSPRVYAMALVALLVLTVVTVGVAQINFGPFNLVIALLVAIAKASVVMLVFMGLWWDEGFNRFAFLSSLLFLFLFFLFTFADVWFRGYRSPLETELLPIKSPVRPYEAGASSAGGH